MVFVGRRREDKRRDGRRREGRRERGEEGGREVFDKEVKGIYWRWGWYVVSYDFDIS